MKRFLFLLILSATFTLSAQQDIAVFVYSTSKLNEPTNALRSRITSALYNNAGGRYTVVDRSEEFWKILGMEYGYQERGYVSDKELVAAAKQLGADKVCGVVITYYAKEGYFIECKILDVEKNSLEGQAEYPRVGKGDVYIKEIGIATSQMVAASIAEQLDMVSVGMKEEAERIRAEQEKKKKEDEKKTNDKAAKERRKATADKFHCVMASQGGSLVSSAVIPGLGLISKGHTAWGVTFLAAEAGLVAGTVVTYTNAQKLLPTLKDPNVTADVFTLANEQYNTNKIMNRVFLGVAAAVYVTNIIATLASDDKNVKEHNCSIDASYIKTDSEYVPSLSLTFKF